MGQLVKLLPGLIVLGIAVLALLNGYVWPWGWAIGVVLLCVGIITLGKKKSDDYNF